MPSEESLSISRMLRNTAFYTIALTAIEFWLGMTLNLETPLPVKNLGFGQSLVYFAGHYQLVMTHVIVAILILGLSVMYLSLSFRVSMPGQRIIGIIGFFAVIGAGISGMAFLASGQFFGYSIGMAMSAVSLLVTYSAGLYLSGTYLGKLSAA